jgi:hypothetical protein
MNGNLEKKNLFLALAVKNDLIIKRRLKNEKIIIVTLTSATSI